MRCTGDGNNSCCPFFDNGTCATSCSENNHVANAQNNYTCCKSYLFHCSYTYQINESIYLSICLPLYLSVCLSACLSIYLHFKNKIVKITNLLVSTVKRNSGNYNLISHVGCYD